MSVNARSGRLLPPAASPAWGLRCGIARHAAYAFFWRSRTEMMPFVAAAPVVRCAFRLDWSSSALPSISPQSTTSCRTILDQAFSGSWSCGPRRTNQRACCWSASGRGAGRLIQVSCSILAVDEHRSSSGGGQEPVVEGHEVQALEPFREAHLEIRFTKNVG